MTQADRRSSDGGELIKQPTPRTQRAEPVAAAEVPERPALAPNVELVGEMRETGFKDRQWLIQRDKRFIQVTELLYRVVEHVSGERTLKEIAARVTESTDWQVSAENVRRIIESKLIPLGLVVAAEHTPVFRDGAAGQGRTSSPLQFQMRVKVLSPRTIDPITKVLQVLFAPPILIPLLTLIAIAHGWLYLVHGVAGSIYDALYTPGLLLIVLAIMLVSGAFHEFGHASALRYGGGQVRGMGAGIYLIYPAFYTDTTDSYRLGRWGRLRTDLGGFYFYLVFALGIMALYFVSGQEFLLLVVVALNLDIIRQFLPFVRLDGYWILADLTGVPDFFSQMGPFLRSVLPILRWKGSRLPDLKPWVKVVFAAYILITIPVLGLLMFYLAAGLPLLMAVLWDSSLKQAEAFSYSLSNGDFLLMAASGSQVLIIALEILGIAYLIYTLTWKLTKAGWNWSKLTPARRAIGALIVTGVVTLVAFLWVS